MDNREELVQKVNLFLYVQSEIREKERVSDIWLVREQHLEIGEGRKLGRELQHYIFFHDVLRTALQLTDRLDQANDKY